MGRIALLLVAILALGVACGETRLPIGDECLRDDDCLSGVCASRACAAAPPLTTGGGRADNEEPNIPDASPDSAPRDASAEGG